MKNRFRNTAHALGLWLFCFFLLNFNIQAADEFGVTENPEYISYGIIGIVILLFAIFAVELIMLFKGSKSANEPAGTSSSDKKQIKDIAKNLESLLSYLSNQEKRKFISQIVEALPQTNNSPGESNSDHQLHNQIAQMASRLRTLENSSNTINDISEDLTILKSALLAEGESIEDQELRSTKEYIKKIEKILNNYQAHKALADQAIKYKERNKEMSNGFESRLADELEAKRAEFENKENSLNQQIEEFKRNLAEVEETGEALRSENQTLSIENGRFKSLMPEAVTETFAQLDPTFEKNQSLTTVLHYLLAVKAYAQLAGESVENEEQVVSFINGFDKVVYNEFKDRDGDLTIFTVRQSLEPIMNQEVLDGTDITITWPPSGEDFNEKNHNRPQDATGDTIEIAKSALIMKNGLVRKKALVETR